MMIISFATSSEANAAAQKETPFSGRKPEDAILGGVSLFYTIPFIGMFVKHF
jgi:hypothetical protein